MERIANLTEVFKVNVDDEVRWYDFAFVLANVLRAQLHLTCLYVVASLNERCIEH